MEKLTQVFIIVTIGLTALLQTVCIAGEIDLAELKKADWIHLETENFNVITDAKEEKALEIIRELENFRFFLGVVLNYQQQPLSEKVSVVAAKNEVTFRATGIPGNYSGLFIQGRDYVVFARCDSFIYSLKGRRIPGRCAVLHELVHLFVHNSTSELDFPPWYDEGIAEYFSTYIERDGTVMYGDLGDHKNQFTNILMRAKGRRRIDTASLFKTTRIDLNIFNTTREHRNFLKYFYTHSFLVIHYMFRDNDRAKKMSQFLSSLREGSSIDESFKNAFNMSYSDLDRKLENYFKSKYLKDIAFYPEKIEIAFPEVKYKKHDITKGEAMKFLYSKISMLPEKLLGEGNLKKFNNDMEKLYPGLVDNAQGF